MFNCDRRSRSFIYFMFLITVCGMDYNVVLVSLWYYLKEDVKTDNVSVFYGAIQASCPIVALLLSPVFGRLHDKYENIRHLIFFNLFAALVGSLLYTIYYSVWFVFFGRALSGCALLIRPLVYSEVFKLYNKKELPRKLLLLGLCNGIGMVIGPLTAEPLKFIYFKIGSFKLHYLNLVGIEMGFLIFIMLCVGYFMLSNFQRNNGGSKEDMETECEIEELVLEGKSKDIPQISSNKFSDALKIIFFNFDFTLLVAIGFVNWTNAVFFEAMIPVVVRESLKWEQSSIIYIFGMKAVFSILFFLAFAFCKIESIILYYIASIGILCIGLALGVLMFETFVETSNVIYALVWSLSGLTIPMSEFLEFMYLPGAASQTIDITVRSFGEGVRSSFVRTGGAIGYCIVGFGLNILSTYGTITIITAIILFTLFLLRRKTLSRLL